MTLTTEHRKRTERALAETNAFIAREERHDPALRMRPTQELLDWSYRHRAKLQNMLAE